MLHLLTNDSLVFKFELFLQALITTVLDGPLI